MKWRLIRRRPKRRTSVTKHFVEHKEVARQLIHQKLEYWNQFYGLEYKRVSIRNTRRRWGSCTSLKNLNFSYKILFLPVHLQDYIVVHELCHLQELNHGSGFWSLVEKQIPNYQTCILELRTIDTQFFKNSTATFENASLLSSV